MPKSKSTFKIKARLPEDMTLREFRALYPKFNIPLLKRALRDWEGMGHREDYSDDYSSSWSGLCAYFDREHDMDPETTFQWLYRMRLIPEGENWIDALSLVEPRIKALRSIIKLYGGKLSARKKD